MRSLWSPDVVPDRQNYISGVHVHSCPCALPRCLWTLGPHRHSCDWSLSEWKVRPSQMPKATHTHTHSRRKQIPFVAFPGGFHNWDSWWLSSNSAPLARVQSPPPPKTAVKGLNTRHVKVNDTVGWYCRWVGGILLHPTSIHPSFPPCTHCLVHKTEMCCVMTLSAAFFKAVSGVISL